MRELTIDQALHNQRYQFIDVRSPSEFQDSHIPGSVNIPLFTDAEREEIGTLYKQVGADAAKWRAMEIVSPKIPALLYQIREIGREQKEPAIYCWRGGSRSKAITTFAALAGIPCIRIIGGYRAYRQHILEQIGPELLPKQMVVLHGLTGIGKTHVLALLQERKWPVLDLEGLANHRGSVFGDFGHWEAHNQKMFDSLLYENLVHLQGAPFVIVEAESKRIGKAVQPEFLVEAKKKGVNLLLEAPLPIRVERIYSEYVEPYLKEAWIKGKVNEAYYAIHKRLNHDLQSAILSALEQEDYRTFIMILLKDYYDPMYSHKQEEYENDFYKIDVTNINEGVKQIESLLQTLFTASLKK